MVGSYKKLNGIMRLMTLVADVHCSNEKERVKCDIVKWKWWVQFAAGLDSDRRLAGVFLFWFE